MWLDYSFCCLFVSDSLDGLVVVGLLLFEFGIADLTCCLIASVGCFVMIDGWLVVLQLLWFVGVCIVLDLLWNFLS